MTYLGLDFFVSWIFYRNSYQCVKISLKNRLGLLAFLCIGNLCYVYLRLMKDLQSMT